MSEEVATYSAMIMVITFVGGFLFVAAFRFLSEVSRGLGTMKGRAVLAERALEFLRGLVSGVGVLQEKFAERFEKYGGLLSKMKRGCKKMESIRDGVLRAFFAQVILMFGSVCVLIVLVGAVDADYEVARMLVGWSMFSIGLVGVLVVLWYMLRMVNAGVESFASAEVQSCWLDGRWYSEFKGRMEEKVQGLRRGEVDE